MTRGAAAARTQACDLILVFAITLGKTWILVWAQVPESVRIVALVIAQALAHALAWVQAPGLVHRPVLVHALGLAQVPRSDLVRPLVLILRSVRTAGADVVWERGEVLGLARMVALTQGALAGGCAGRGHSEARENLDFPVEFPVNVLMEGAVVKVDPALVTPCHLADRLVGQLAVGLAWVAEWVAEWGVGRIAVHQIAVHLAAGQGLLIDEFNG